MRHIITLVFVALLAHVLYNVLKTGLWVGMASMFLGIILFELILNKLLGE